MYSGRHKIDIGRYSFYAACVMATSLTKLLKTNNERLRKIAILQQRNAQLEVVLAELEKKVAARGELRTPVSRVKHFPLSTISFQLDPSF